MTDLKLNLLPDLEVIEKFILDNGINEYKASTPEHTKYLYQLFKQNSLKYKYYLKNSTIDTKLALVFIEELIRNLDEIFYKLSRRILRIKTNIEYNTVTTNTDKTNTYNYENTKDTKTFIYELTNYTDDMLIILLKKYIKENKENFYFKVTIERKLNILTNIFIKFNEIYKNLDLKYKKCTIENYFNKIN